MKRQIPIRIRLTFWYSLVLAAGLIVFAGGFWIALRHALYASIESDLKQHVEGLIKVLKTEVDEKVPPDQLREEFAEYANAIPEGSWIQVRDGRGNVLLASAKPGTGHDLTFSNSVTARETKYTVFAAASLRNADTILSGMAWMMLFVIPAALALGGLGGYALSGRVLAPVDQVTAAARSITIQNLSRRLTVPQTGDEFQRLSEAWNDTLERLDGAVKRLAQFTADASHELRTPVALIRASAEVALRRPRTPEDYRETLRQIADESERTSRIVEDLLMLARADAGVQPVPMTRVDLAGLVLEAGEHARAVGAGRGLRIAAETPDEPIPLNGNEAGLRRLFSVLVENAVKYTPEGGEVRVSLLRSGHGAEVRVLDTGIGMSADAIPHIFERFYRADESRNREAGGVGLGLSIAQWIADRHGAKIVVESTAGRGSVFTVKFPSCA